MGERIVIESPAPPEAVLAAIHEDGREWREPVIPPALHREGRFRIITGGKGNIFWLVLPSQRRDEEEITLRGMVSPAPGGGSVVRATFQIDTSDAYVLGGLGILAAFWSLPAGLLLIAMGAAWGGLGHWNDSRLSRETSAVAAYLDERLRAAVMRAAEPGAAAQPHR